VVSVAKTRIDRCGFRCCEAFLSLRRHDPDQVL